MAILDAIRNGDVATGDLLREAVLRLLGLVLLEQNDEWLVGHTYVSAASMAALRRPPAEVPSLLPDGTAA